MSKILLLFTVVMAVIFHSATASAVRRRGGGGGEKGMKVTNRRTMYAHSPRRLSHQYSEYTQSFIPGGKGKGAPPPPTSKSKGTGKGKGSKGSTSSKSGSPGSPKARPECRPVVEGAEFIVEGAITMTMANMTDDTKVIGTEFIYNGPLLEFSDQDELVELENFFMSGSCVRTQERDGEMPGAGHCSFTITLDTGATVNYGGEAFDGWDNLMAINGGSQELIGLSGTVTLIGLNDAFEDTDEDFFSVPWIYGETVLVYQICPQGYWDRYVIADHDALPPPSIPDPFAHNAVVQPVEVVAVPVAVDPVLVVEVDDAVAGDDAIAGTDDYDYDY
jgi:hypothetical protein